MAIRPSKIAVKKHCARVLPAAHSEIGGLRMPDLPKRATRVAASRKYEINIPKLMSVKGLDITYSQRRLPQLLHS